MPTYEYRCAECEHEFEKDQKVNDPKPPCPKCGAEEPRRLISKTSFQLNGSGWGSSGYS